MNLNLCAGTTFVMHVDKLPDYHGAIRYRGRMIWACTHHHTYRDSSRGAVAAFPCAARELALWDRVP